MNNLINLEIARHVARQTMAKGAADDVSATIEYSLRLIPPEKLIGTILNKAESETMGYYYY